MSKSMTPKRYYDIASECNDKMNECCDHENDPTKIKLYHMYASLVADLTWISLITGYSRGAWGMFGLYEQGIGVEQDDFLAGVMYGLAVKCDNYDDAEVRITEKMYPIIDKLHYLVIDAQQNYMKNGSDLGIQIERFNAVILPDNNSVDYLLFKNSDAVSELANYDIQQLGNIGNAAYEDDNCCGCTIL